jgi:hypothetical protein
MANAIEQWADKQSKALAIPWLTIIEAILSLFEHCNDDSERINNAISHKKKRRILQARATSRLAATIADDCPELSRWQCRTKARAAISNAFNHLPSERLKAIQQLRGEVVARSVLAELTEAAGETT